VTDPTNTDPKSRRCVREVRYRLPNRIASSLFENIEPEGAPLAASSHALASGVTKGFIQETKNDRLRAQEAKDGWRSPVATAPAGLSTSTETLRLNRSPQGFPSV
jgi:hypothetical protein